MLVAGYSFGGGSRGALSGPGSDSTIQSKLDSPSNIVAMLQVRVISAVAFGSFAALASILPKISDAQNGSGMESVPLGSLSILEAAKQSVGRGKAYEERGDLVDAFQEYEAVIAKAEELPAVSRTYEVKVTEAGAHLDAARARIAYASTLTNSLQLTEQNAALISRHLRAVPDLIVSAARDGATPESRVFACRAYKLLAEGAFITGVTNRSAKDLESAQGACERVAGCDPSSRAHAQQMISYTKGVEREITHSPVSADNVAKIVSKFAGVAVPKGGSFLAAAIDIGYDFYKQRKKAPNPGF
jgi:hypothetical protein